MPRVVITEGAAIGLERCRKFLTDLSHDAAGRAGQIIANQLTLLEQSPELGRPFEPDSTIRELVISFGNSGYVALYRYVPSEDTCFVLAFRHQREAGYEP